MRRTLELHRDQRGLVGKIMGVWLLVVAVFVVGAVDAGSIAVTTFELSSVATDAAIDGALEYGKGSGGDAACQAAQTSVEASKPELKIGQRFCRIDATTGRVTITLRDTAGTILIGRLSFTKHYATVVGSETKGSPDV